MQEQKDFPSTGTLRFPSESSEYLLPQLFYSVLHYSRVCTPEAP